MIALLCNSTYLSSEIASSILPLSSVSFNDNNENFQEDPIGWLSNCLLNNFISIVFYESRYFVDPSYFRLLSPDTSFILVSSYGEDYLIEEALVGGANAFLQKPLRMPELDGVLTLVKK